jgi:acyl phosphate:glycerol-3-phosphate acyltransferase
MASNGNDGVTWTSLIWISLILASYLIGSVPSAYLVTRLLKGQDIRQLGDGNAGAANVFRAVGSGAGLTVGIIDIGKGAAAVLLARGVLDSSTAQMVAGVAVVAGHNWPVQLGWRGGRGAATAVGVSMVLLPIPAVPLGILSLFLLYWTKSTIKALSFFLIPIPFLAWILGHSYPLVAYSVGMPLMVGLSHYLSIKSRRRWDADLSRFQRGNV